MNCIIQWKQLRVIIPAAAALSYFAFAEGQAPSTVESALATLASPDMSTRSSSFYALVGPSGYDSTGSVDHGLKNLFLARPEMADRIKTAFVTELLREGAYRERVEEANGELSEEFLNYFADLIVAVGPLRDPRAAKGLIAALDTGGMALGLFGRPMSRRS